MNHIEPLQRLEVRRPPSCAKCTHNSHCAFSGIRNRLSDECAAVLQRCQPVRAGTPLSRRGGPFSCVFLVCKGALKTQRVTTSGELVVSGFYLPGEVAGFESAGEPEYCCDILATVDSEVCRLDFDRLFMVCAGEPAMRSWMVSCIGSFVRQKDNDLTWSSAMRTEDRVLRFFTGLYQRLGGSGGRRCSLPMRKQDIASYLHMTPETLSRNLARLRKRGLLCVDDSGFEPPATGPSPGAIQH